MEAHQTQAGAVGQPRAVTRQRYLSVRLTENEAMGSTILAGISGPLNIMFPTKRPEFFCVGAHVRFRNLLSEYGWRIARTEPGDRGRSQVVCCNPNKIYGRRRLATPETAIL